MSKEDRETCSAWPEARTAMARADTVPTNIAVLSLSRWGPLQLLRRSQQPALTRPYAARCS